MTPIEKRYRRIAVTLGILAALLIVALFTQWIALADPFGQPEPVEITEIAHEDGVTLFQFTAAGYTCFVARGKPVPFGSGAISLQCPGTPGR